MQFTSLIKKKRKNKQNKDILDLLKLFNIMKYHYHVKIDSY